MEGRVCDMLAILSVLKSVNERGDFVLSRKNQNWLELNGWLVKSTCIFLREKFKKNKRDKMGGK